MLGMLALLGKVFDERYGHVFLGGTEGISDTRVDTAIVIPMPVRPTVPEAEVIPAPYG